MHADWILLADLDDLIRIALIVIFVIGPLIGQMGKNRQRKGPVQQPAHGKPAAPRPAQQPKGLAAEIERILREAEKAARDAAGKVEVVAQEELPRAEQGKEGPNVPVAKPQPAASSRRQRRLRSSVTKHVQDHIQSHPVSEHSQELGQRILQAQDRVEKRLHDAFDHQVGDLDAVNVGRLSEGTQSGTDSGHWQQLAIARADAAKVALARQELIHAMFHDREQLRNAFVLAEIIRRPRSEDVDAF